MEDALVMALMASTQPMSTAKVWQAEYMKYKSAIPVVRDCIWNTL